MVHVGRDAGWQGSRVYILSTVWEYVGGSAPEEVRGKQLVLIRKQRCMMTVTQSPQLLEGEASIGRAAH
jgi:hypothetical protein